MYTNSSSLFCNHSNNIAAGYTAVLVARNVLGPHEIDSAESEHATRERPVSAYAGVQGICGQGDPWIPHAEIGMSEGYDICMQR